MKFYFAPMEGITGYIYRNAHQACFQRPDKYFSPFIEANQKGTIKGRSLRDILPENNQNITLVPQILTNNAENFVKTAKTLQAYGYEEVNLNLGCPSGTVVSKRKGAGFLAYPEELDAFLAAVFEGLDMKISVKTRLGMKSPEEFEALLTIYRRYPISELIVHPRVREDYYKNTPKLEIFRRAIPAEHLETITENETKLCYNGDLFSVEDYRRVTGQIPEVDTIMFGRGLLMNPALLQQIEGGDGCTAEVFREFHQRIFDGYREILSGDRDVLFKMKELWYYMSHLFTDSESYLKKIRKAQSCSAYEAVVLSLLREQKIQ